MNFRLLILKLSKKITNINFRKYERLMMILYIISHLEEDAVEEELLKSLQEKDIFYTVLKKVELCLNKGVIETASSHTPALPSTSSSTKESDL